MNRGAMSAAERRVRSKLAKLVHDRQMLHANVVKMARTCGNPNCKCAVKGEKHVSLYLSRRKGNYSGSIAVENGDFKGGRKKL